MVVTPVGRLSKKNDTFIIIIPIMEIIESIIVIINKAEEVSINGVENVSEVPLDVGEVAGEVVSGVGGVALKVGEVAKDGPKQ